VKFSEVVNQASALLHSKSRITYHALKREYDLDDAALEDLKEELIEAERVAIDENGKILDRDSVSSKFRVQSSQFSQAPSP
jgi:hypothetical protein